MTLKNAFKWTVPAFGFFILSVPMMACAGLAGGGNNRGFEGPVKPASEADRVLSPYVGGVMARAEGQFANGQYQKAITTSEQPFYKGGLTAYELSYIHRFQGACWEALGNREKAYYSYKLALDFGGLNQVEAQAVKAKLHSLRG
ncbi:MAG: hypothetical protein V3U82_05010 [Robiginitomaculum sp.]